MQIKLCIQKNTKRVPNNNLTHDPNLSFILFYMTQCHMLASKDSKIMPKNVYITYYCNKNIVKSGKVRKFSEKHSTKFECLRSSFPSIFTDSIISVFYIPSLLEIFRLLIWSIIYQHMTKTYISLIIVIKTLLKVWK